VPKERTVTVSKLTAGLGLTEAGIRVFEESDWNGQRAAATGQRIMWMLACSEEILKEKKGSLPRQSSVLNFFKSSSRTRALSPVLDIGNDDPDNSPTVGQEVPYP
jgi:hypothetical protein